MLGATAATLVAIPILLKRPLVGEAGNLGGYFHGSPTWHVLGLLAGAVWGVFVWDVFAKGPASSRAFIGAALVLYAVGIATMAIAYTF